MNNPAGRRRASTAAGSGTAPISPARAAAFAILERVGQSSAHSDDLLHGPGLSGLTQADRNLTTTLVLGVLRWQIALDARLRPLLQRPDVALASPVATSLRMGAFQLLYLDRIPAHAALSESVELVRAAGHAHAAGMVNAVLRHLTREPAPVPKLYETTAALAERLAHPRWLVERWVRAYGRSGTLAALEYDQRPPVAGGLFPPEAAEGTSHPAVRLPQMDEGSRLVAELAAASQPAARRIWDCCAAPGGKTIVLARRHPEAALLASDLSPKRVQALEKRLRDAAPTARTVQADAARLPEAEGEFDLVLCDAPCTGTGTLARNPEIKDRLRPEDLSRQAERQRTLLCAALRRLAPGGRLVYSTCSLEREENEDVVEAVLGKTAAGAGISRVPVSPVLEKIQASGLLLPQPQVEEAVRDGCLRTLPGGSLPGDGFFAAVLQRE